MSEEIKMPMFVEPTTEDLIDSPMNSLNPRQQRFVHMYVSGQYSLKQISELMGVQVQTIRSWLKGQQLKTIIGEIQADEDDIVRQGLKAIRMKALYKMSDLINSNIDGIAYQAARDVLDRTGFKPPTKQETKTEVHITFEQQLKDAIQSSNNPNEFIETDDYEVIE